MDFKLSDSQRQYVEAVRALAQNDFKPRPQNTWMVRFRGKT